MTELANATTLVLIIAAVIAAVMAAYWYSQRQKLAADLDRLENDARARTEEDLKKEASLSELRRSLDRLRAHVEKSGVDPATLEEATTDSNKSQRADKRKSEKVSKDSPRIRELQGQLDESRRQLDTARNQLRVRDGDVKTLKSQLEDALAKLEAHRLEAQRAEAQKAEADRLAALRADDDEPEVLSNVAPVRPVTKVELSEAEIDARVAQAESQVKEAENASRDAKERANRAEFELRKATERLNRLDKRSHELVNRLVVAERDARTTRRQLEASDRMYQGLKGRFEVAQDTLASFNRKFGVPIPTEIGVELYGNMEDYVELEEEPRPARPRGRRSDPSDFEQAEPAEAVAPTDAPVSALADAPSLEPLTSSDAVTPAPQP